MEHSEDTKKPHDKSSFLDERKKVLEIAGVNDLEVLDVGAGPLCIMAAKGYDCFVTSIDIDTEKIAVWEEKAENEGVSEKISFEKEDVTNLSYCNDAFDVGICFGALHHIPEDKREKALAEISRVSYLRFIIAEFTPEGFEILHGKDGFTGVDLHSLESYLNKSGSLRVVPLENLNVYIIEKKV
ncbi:ubiquinone/menaquinone biosynthesis C-methylase UbiE [Methanomicrobium sp. W14]|uniref:class I SAM-dependent methyltransferase n=1 Tax=Methanomicrobium sp. W14 TaxID=2817839 RepID=UPI001AE65592|nr:class I SAM-dependent methyltransferase [Methanomicrobium sp. W14]MBP2134213.1 ubiquinone/menaquinone biosynthesis C-methylase UbiE [Methanomicrobium sp. W14]